MTPDALSFARVLSTPGSCWRSRTKDAAFLRTYRDVSSSPFLTKGPDKGTGLGLSISRAIVESFDGTLDIASQPAIETCAAIRLPTAAK